MGRPPTKTIHGHDLAEVVSALQKAVRRGEHDDAIYWTGEMQRSGYERYCWSRLGVILSEDVGISAPGVAADFWALQQLWEKFNKEGKATRDLFLAHAVLLLTHAPKSHTVLHATMYMSSFSDLLPPLEISDHVFDMHTRRGRQMKRGGQHFVDVSSRLENEDDSKDSPKLKALWEHAVGKLGYDTSKGEIKNPVKFGRLGRPLGDERSEGTGTSTKRDDPGDPEDEDVNVREIAGQVKLL